MIKYNNSNINDWNFGEDNIIKVYRNNAVCYYKIIGTPPAPTAQTPCFAVVEDISQYSETEFEDVFNKADGNWYKLNNLNNYEEYGVYGTGRTITYYDGKLTIDDGYEYLYSGNTWNNMGAVSGSSRLPQGYTEVEYIENQYMAYIDAGFKPNQDTRMYMNMQMVTSNSGGRYISAGSCWSCTPNTIAFDYESNTLHVKYANVGGWTTYSDVTMDYDPHEYDFNKNEFYVDGTFVGSTSYASFQCDYNLAIFAFVNAGSQGLDYEQFLGKMYWFKLFDNDTLIRDFVPCKNSSNVYGAYDLVNDVFYPSANQGSAFTGGSESTPVEYPVYYDEMQDPPDNVTFTSMTEAQSYECPWVGMKATIAGTRYVFNSQYQWEELTEYYTVDLNSQWEASTSYGSITDTSDYDFYQSFSNYHVNNGLAEMSITIEGYTEFTIKVRSYAEGSYDYVQVLNLDDESVVSSWNRNTSAGEGTYSQAKVKYTGKNVQSQTVWNSVTFSNLDGNEHTIRIIYGKDGSADSGDDRGYVAIQKEQS